jgi:glutathione synthase/RimK-type ligase-like ATP-grasp enzyme
MYMKKSQDVLVLFSYKSHKRGYIEMLFERLRDASQKYSLSLSRGSLSDAHIIVKDNVLSMTESMTGRDLASFGLIYFELWYKAPEVALAAALYARRHNVPFFSEELEHAIPLTKVGELAVLSDNGVPLPNSFASSRAETLKVFKDQAPLEYPLIVKAADGYGGNNNFLISDYAALKEVLNSHKDLRFVIQEFIPNDCDYRCLILGGKIALVLKRTRDQNSDSHLNNTSQGGEGEVVPIESLSTQAQTAVLKAAKLLRRNEFAGVDLMINSETGQPYILEVNQTPQIEIGAQVDQKMDALLSYMNTRITKGERHV